MVFFRFSHPKISTKIVLSSLVGIVLLMIGILSLLLPYLEEFALSERRFFLKEKTTAVLNLFHQYQDDVDTGRLSLSEAQERATRRLKSMVYSKGDYFWIMSDELPYPKMIMHPLLPQEDGKYLDDSSFNRATASRTRHDIASTPLDRANLFKTMASLCQESGSGYVSYLWPKPLPGGGSTETLYPKESFVASFKPWGWIIGTGEYIDDLEAVINKMRTATFAYLGFVGLLAVGVALFMASSITKPLRRVVAATRSIARGDLDTRTGITSASDELAQLSSNFDHMARELHLREEERRSAQALLAASEKKFRTMVEHSRELFGLLSPEGAVLEANPAALSVIGARLEDVSGKSFWDTPWWNDDPQKQLQLKQALEQARAEGLASFETFHTSMDGRRIRIDFTVQSVRDDEGNLLLFIAEGRDITERFEMESKLRHMALHDQLTGLANRALLLDRIGQALLWLQNNPAWVFAVLFIDIDRFKVINDSLGHSVGDEILKTVAARLRSVLADGDTLARYGGDEFVALVRGIRLGRESIRLARAIATALAKPIAVADTTVSLQASIGIELNPTARSTPDELIRNANLAMLQAKLTRNGRPKVFTKRLLEDITSIRVMEQELPAALGNGQLQLYYQPIMDASKGNRLMGFEALCRWQHPEYGFIPPMSFIRMAEETGIIARLGEWVLDRACATLHSWSRDLPFAGSLFVSVNVSPKQLATTGFNDAVRNALARHGLKPGQLHLEITETTIMDSSAQLIERLRELVRLGVRLSIDDFGTGYSNLALLTRLPVSNLKIDLSIVMGMESKPANSAVIRTIVNMAQALSLTVVAEGVETTRQRDMLLALGCSMQQGYLHARPMNEDAALTLLTSLLAVEETV